MREEFPILRDRLGDGRYNGYESAANPEVGLDNAGFWARVEGSKRSIAHDGDFTTGEWDASRGEIEIGVDIPMDAFDGVGVFGISAHAVRGNASANSGITPDPDVAEVTTTGFGAGLSFAWFPGGGFYTDVQGRLTAWDADVELDTRDIDQDIDGIGWGASLEVGNRFQVAPNTAIIPRGQVVYTDVSFDSFEDDDGVDVSQDDSASVVISGGLTVEQMFPDNGIAIFADASVNYDFLDDSSIDASDVTFESGLEDTWGALAIGATMGIADGASAYVAADIASPLSSNFGDSYGYGFRAGFRIDF
jgi:outer membrane autotransporter protein